MCYDIEVLMERLVRNAKREGEPSVEIDRLVEQLLENWYGKEYYHTSGFDHPSITCVTNNAGYKLEPMQWGLIPQWVKSIDQAHAIQNQTLIARSETVFEKPAFKHAAQHQRCVVPVSAFYEHHHKFKKTFPYHISRADNKPLLLAGIWEEWRNPETNTKEKTFAILTTEANESMATIHNNPDREGPRMPVILDAIAQHNWLSENSSENDIINLLHPCPEGLLKSYTVRPLRGKSSSGNSPEAVKPHTYQELQTEQGNLFA